MTTLRLRVIKGHMRRPINPVTAQMPAKDHPSSLGEAAQTEAAGAAGAVEVGELGEAEAEEEGQSPYQDLQPQTRTTSSATFRSFADNVIPIAPIWYLQQTTRSG
jgi:hypothetical protein